MAQRHLDTLPVFLYMHTSRRLRGDTTGEGHRRNKAVFQSHRLGGLALNDTKVDLLVVNASSILLTANLDLIENILGDGTARREAKISSRTVKNRAVIFGRLEEVHLFLTLQARSQTELAALNILAGDDGPIIRASVGEGIGPGHIKQFSRVVCGTSNVFAINSFDLMRLMDKALGIDFDTANSWFLSGGSFFWRSRYRFNNLDRVNAPNFCNHSIVFNSWDYGSQCWRCDW